MKIIYDNKQKMYGVVIDYSETTTWINTDDIATARKEFIERMTWMFNNAICKQLIDTQKETSINQTCQSECDHEWECCGASTAGFNYVCKKCYAHKFEPIQMSPPEQYLTSEPDFSNVAEKLSTYASNFEYKPPRCIQCKRLMLDSQECYVCCPDNNFRYFEAKE